MTLSSILSTIPSQQHHEKCHQIILDLLSYYEKGKGEGERLPRNTLSFISQTALNNISSISIVEDTLKLLSIISQNADQIDLQIRLEGLFIYIIKIIKRHDTLPICMTFTCRFLKFACCESKLNTRIFLKEKKCWSLLFKIFKNHYNNENVFLELSKLLVILTKDNKIGNEFMKNQGMSYLILCLNDYWKRNNYTILKYLAKIIKHISRHPITQPKIYLYKEQISFILLDIFKNTSKTIELYKCLKSIYRCLWTLHCDLLHDITDEESIEINLDDIYILNQSFDNYFKFDKSSLFFPELCHISQFNNITSNNDISTEFNTILKSTNEENNIKMPNSAHEVLMAQREQNIKKSEILFNQGNYNVPIQMMYMLERLAIIKENQSQFNLNIIYDSKTNINTKFNHSLKFESRFECGNLRRVIQVNETEYDLFMSSDTYDMKDQKGRNYFYFSIDNIRPNIKYKFNVINYILKTSLFNRGRQPVAFSIHGNSWFHVGDDICYYPSPYASKIQKTTKKGEKLDITTTDIIWPKPYYCLSFSITFKTSELHYIASSYPYSYSDLQEFLQSRNKLIIKYTTLCKSLLNYNCDLLTITDFDVAHEKKEYILFTARVHPGETSASWTLHGILEFLTSDEPIAQHLRKCFIFKIIPMLNPDGVVKGNARHDLFGKDLNRIWDFPDPKTKPTIYATRKFASILASTQKLALFIDFHGHARKMDAFMFGCDPLKSQFLSMTLDHNLKNVDNDNEEENNAINKLEEFEKLKLRIRMLPYLLAIENKDFNYGNCNFVLQKSKLVTARGTIAHEFGIPGSYTFEVSHGGISATEEQFNIVKYVNIGKSLCDCLWQLARVNDEDLINRMKFDMKN